MVSCIETSNKDRWQSCARMQATIVAAVGTIMRHWNQNLLLTLDEHRCLKIRNLCHFYHFQHDDLFNCNNLYFYALYSAKSLMVCCAAV